jgi:hypothetical protein
MHYPGASGIPLSSECFRSVISLPFEARVQSVLTSAGFRAGRVNEKGTWFPQNERPVNISVHAGTSIPGEIDVLAVHPDGRIVVCECKVLAIPWDDKRLRNVLGKLGKEDAEEILSKVIRKLAWIRLVESNLVSCRIRDRAAIIVLDRPWPGIGMSDEVSIVDITMLDQSLTRLAARWTPLFGLRFGSVGFKTPGPTTEPTLPSAKRCKPKDYMRDPQPHTLVCG